MRPPRIEFPGAMFHVMARGNEGQEIFRDDEDRQFFIAKLLDLRERAKFSIHAFCLMGNHFHLLLEMAQTTLASAMQRLLGSYAKRFNWRHQRRGHLFQDRYKSILCPRDSYFLELVRYIHLNPVRAGFVERPEQWLWSGHNEIIRGDFHVVEGTFVRGLFGDGASAVRSYLDFVDAGTKMSVDEAEFDEIDYGTKTAVVSRDILASLGRLAAAAGPVPIADVRGGKKFPAVVTARNALIASAVDRGIPRAELAAYLGCSRGAISRTLTRLGR